MQKIVKFYHKEGIDMLKLGYTLLNLSSISLHRSASAKFYPFTEGDEDLLSIVREDMFGGPSIVFTREAVVDETHIRKSTNVCKMIVAKDACQILPYSLFQSMPTDMYTRYDFDADLQRLKPLENKSRRFEKIVKS